MQMVKNISKRSNRQPHTRQKYSRISSNIKEQLFELIFFHGKKIKEAAQDLHINYSSAKTILYLKRQKFQKQCKSTIESSTQRCSYKKGSQLIELICTRGGNDEICYPQETKYLSKQKQNQFQNRLKPN